jgi:hypothetical protein
MKSVTVTAVENESSDGNTSSERKRGSKGRLVELLKQAGAWQVMNARRRGDGPWTLNRFVLLILSCLCVSLLYRGLKGQKVGK